MLWNMKQTLRNAKHLKNILIACLAGLPSLAALGDGTNNIPNPLIDYTSFLATATEVGRVREARRVSEDRFIKMAAEPGTIVLDARSDDKYNRLHIKGSRHLSFSEITAENLAMEVDREIWIMDLNQQLTNGTSLADLLASTESRYIQRSLLRSDGNRHAAAKLLGIDIARLEKKLAEHGLDGRS